LLLNVDISLELVGIVPNTRSYPAFSCRVISYILRGRDDLIRLKMLLDHAVLALATYSLHGYYDLNSYLRIEARRQHTSRSKPHCRLLEEFRQMKREV
jgi:hypothetical protein